MNPRPPRCERGALPAELLPRLSLPPGGGNKSVAFKGFRHFLKRLAELIDVVFKDNQADPLVAVLIMEILGLDDVNKARSALLFFQVKKVSSLAARNLLAVYLFRAHLPSS